MSSTRCKFTHYTLYKVCHVLTTTVTGSSLEVLEAKSRPTGTPRPAATTPKVSHSPPTTTKANSTTIPSTGPPNPLIGTSMTVRSALSNSPSPTTLKHPCD